MSVGLPLAISYHLIILYLLGTDQGETSQSTQALEQLTTMDTSPQGCPPASGSATTPEAQRPGYRWMVGMSTSEGTIL